MISCESPRIILRSKCVKNSGAVKNINCTKFITEFHINATSAYLDFMEKSNLFSSFYIHTFGLSKSKNFYNHCVFLATYVILRWIYLFQFSMDLPFKAWNSFLTVSMQIAKRICIIKNSSNTCRLTLCYLFLEIIPSLKGEVHRKMKKKYIL